MLTFSLIVSSKLEISCWSSSILFRLSSFLDSSSSTLFFNLETSISMSKLTLFSSLIVCCSSPTLPRNSITLSLSTEISSFKELFWDSRSAASFSFSSSKFRIVSINCPCSSLPFSSISILCRSFSISSTFSLLRSFSPFTSVSKFSM